MRWIGLTGGIATGKSEVSKILRDLGHLVVDADALAREVVAPGSAGLQAVVQRFGSEILTAQGELDRKKLGQRVFGQPGDLRDLENLLHPLIQTRVREIRTQAEKAGRSVAFYDVPLLFEKNLGPQFDSILVVTCSEALQLQRIRDRDGLSEAEAKQRLASQWPLKDKESRASYLIRNEGTRDELKSRVQQVLNSLARELA